MVGAPRHSPSQKRTACRGNEGFGNRQGGLAVEIGVEDRKVEVGVLRRFQRLFDARGFGGDGVAEFAEHVLQQHADHRLVFDDEDPLGLRGPGVITTKRSEPPTAAPLPAKSVTVSLLACPTLNTKVS
jgi:hypothetical protein